MISAEIISSYQGKGYANASGAATAVEKELKDLEVRAIPSAMKLSMNRYLRLIAGRLSKRHSGAWPGGTGNGKLSRRSGRAAQSIVKSVKVEKEASGDIKGTIGGIWYLRTHENGAIIRAKRSQYLTIPLPAALDSRGVPLKRSARDWANTFIKRSSKGNLIIFQKRGADIVPLYVLKKQVRIPKRLGMKEEILRYENLFLDGFMGDLEREFKLTGNG